jgi:hypothetical protein
MYDLPKSTTLPQEIVASSVLPITEILPIEDHKLDNTFLHVTFGLTKLALIPIEGLREAAGGGGSMGAESNSFVRTGLCLKFNPQS